MSSKTVLITGATSGIGAHTARLLLGRGHRVAVTGRDENLRLHATARGVGVTLVNPGMIDTPFWRGAGVPPSPCLPSPSPRPSGSPSTSRQASTSTP